MGEVMTKEEFMRKMFGHNQTKKNNYLKTLKYNSDADIVSYGNSSRIIKQKHVKW